MATGDSTLLFDGQTSYVEIADSADFSVATTGQLSVSAWIRPDVLTFPAFQSTGYIHWMGKGAQGQQEWVFRMYNETTTDNPPRPNWRRGDRQPFSGSRPRRRRRRWGDNLDL